MPIINIPKGSKISQEDDTKTIQIQIPNTKYWVRGEQKANYLWDVELVDPFTSFKDWIRKDVTTEEFALFSNVILKTPFPYKGKEKESPTQVKKFIKKLTKKQNEPRNKSSRRIRSKSSKLQINRKKRS